MYDLTYPYPPRLANASSRCLVGAGENVAIAGFILGSVGGGSTEIMIRGLGPSLASSMLTGLLQDPVLQLFDKDGILVRQNDNWRDTQRTAIQATGIAPANSRSRVDLIAAARQLHRSFARER
jgi:hypothetical protein